MYYPDMCDYCQGGSGPNVRAIGWLSDKHSFNTGAVSQEFLEALRRNLTNPKQYLLYKGWHDCELCSSESNHRNLYIPTPQYIYIAPAMILHYVEKHQYQPPEEFIEAVLKCPVQGSKEYLQAVEPFMPLKRTKKQIILVPAPPPETPSFEISAEEPLNFVELLENFPHSTEPEISNGSYVIEPDEDA